MPLVKLNSGFFEAFENIENFPVVTLDHQDALDVLDWGAAAGDPAVLQVSSTLVRIRQDFWEPGGGQASYELRLSGSGIGPVRSINALIDAINNGLATGAISNVSIRREGVEVLDLTLTRSGYVLSSGDQSVSLDGSLPLTFAQAFDLAGLFTQAMNLDYLTRAERTALFNSLSEYGVTGLEVADGARTLFALHVGATSASITMNGMTLSVTGTFPDNFGEDLKLLWDAARVFGQSGDIGAVGDFLGNALAISAIEITNDAGRVLASMANPMDAGAIRWKVDGVLRDEMRMGTEWDDFLSGADGTITSALAGMAGNDTLSGLRSSDHLMGGSGNDDLMGGSGDDILDGGTGNDLLIGDTGADEFRFTRRSGSDVILDFEIGQDHLQIAGVTRLGQMTFTEVFGGVLVEYRGLDILVEDTTASSLARAQNFLF